MKPGLFRKEALSRHLRTDAPGAVIGIAPPALVALFAVMLALFAALLALAAFGRALIVAGGRGVVHADEPLIALHAPFSGTVLAVTHGLRERGAAGDVMIEMDARTERAGHEKCAGLLAVAQRDLAGLEQRLADWNQTTGHEHDASMAIVLINQVRAERDKVTGMTQRCDALGSTVERSHVVFPADAVVADLAVSPGAQVHEGDVMAKLVPAEARLVGFVEIPERFRSELAEGQTVRLEFDALPSAEVGAGTGQVIRLLDELPSGVKLDTPSAGGVVAEVSLGAMPPGAGPPRAGMTFNAGVVTGRARVLSLLFAGPSDGA